MVRRTGNIRGRLVKVEELLSKDQADISIMVMAPGETEADHPDAIGARLVVFVTSYGAPGQGGLPETEDIDKQIATELEALKNAGYTEEELEEAVVKSAPRTSLPGSRRRKAENAHPDTITNVKPEPEAGPMMPLDKALASPEVMNSSDYSVDVEFRPDEAEQWRELMAMSQLDLKCLVADGGCEDLLPKVRDRLTARLGGFHNSTPDDWLLL